MKYGLITFVVLSLTGCSLLPSATQPVQEQAPEATESMETTPTERNLNQSDGTEMQANKTNTIYTLTDIAEHNTAEDCWMAIEGKVYDVTEYIAGQKHPGKDAILQGCGKDGTEFYNNRPNGSGAHSDRARSFLPNYYIGDLQQ